jgi:hypothetical protein
MKTAKKTKRQTLPTQFGDNKPLKITEDYLIYCWKDLTKGEQALIGVIYANCENPWIFITDLTNEDEWQQFEEDYVPCDFRVRDNGVNSVCHSMVILPCYSGPMPKKADIPKIREQLKPTILPNDTKITIDRKFLATAFYVPKK